MSSIVLSALVGSETKSPGVIGLQNSSTNLVMLGSSSAPGDIAVNAVVGSSPFITSFFFCTQNCIGNTRSHWVWPMHETTRKLEGLRGHTYERLHCENHQSKATKILDLWTGGIPGNQGLWVHPKTHCRQKGPGTTRHPCWSLRRLKQDLMQTLQPSHFHFLPVTAYPFKEFHLHCVSVTPL